MRLSRIWLWLLLLGPLGLGIARLRFDADILNLLPAKLPVAQGLKIYQQYFANARELIITVETPTADETESAARALALALRAQNNLVTDATWQPAWMENPQQALELLAYLWLNQPSAVFGEWTNRLGTFNLTNTLNETRERLATSFSPGDLSFGGYDPYGLTRLPESVSHAAPSMGSGEEMFGSRDGTFRLLFVQAKPDLTGYLACRSWLAEDFAIVIYQESRSHPEMNGRELRHEAAPGIWWSAVTTAGAFLILNLSTLPGLGQLGSLVAIGIILAAVVMLYAFTPLMLRFRSPADREASALAKRERWLLFETARLLPTTIIWGITVLVLGAASGLIWKNGIRIDNSPDPLRPKTSEAYAALDKIKAHLTGTEDPLWLLVPGQNEAEVGQRLAQAGIELNRAVSNRLISSFTLPTMVWPHPENQRANRPALLALLPERATLHQAALNAGFTTNAFFVVDNIFDV